MSKRASFFAVLTAIVLVIAGVGTYALIGRLSDQAVWVLVGGVGALLVVGGVGVLFIVKDLAQAYVMRRMLAQDDLNDMRQMAMLARLMGGTRTPNVNLRLPPGQQAQPWQVIVPQQQGQPVDLGTFRDTIAGDAVEIE
jgi:cytochrome c biogenesis protein CcdA